MRSPADRVADMLDALTALELYTARGRAAFDADRALRDAITLQVYYFCDAGKEAAKDLGTQFPSTEWSLMARMREFLGHHYYKVDPEIVWSTATTDIPSLRAQLEHIADVLARRQPPEQAPAASGPDRPTSGPKR